MERFNIFLTASAVAFFLATGITPPAGAEEALGPARPGECNIVMIFIDTLRADHLSCYGYFRGTSPNIDRLAEGSVVFRQQFSPISYTLPGFMSIITSLYPKSHGVLRVFKDRLSLRVRTLAEILHLYGYKTAWFGPRDDPQTALEAGFGRGFDETTSLLSKDVDLEEEAVCGWIEKNKDAKFFLNFHTYKTHAPYFTAPQYLKEFTNEKNKGLPEARNSYRRLVYEDVQSALSEKKGAIRDILGDRLAAELAALGLFEGRMTAEKWRAIWLFFLDRNSLYRWNKIIKTVYFSRVDPDDPADRAYLLARYDACILEYDQKVIGPVIEKLRSLGLYDKTIIIICSDHGEEFYEHGSWDHGATLYDEVVHVPFIMRVPWLKHGKKIDALTSNVDIMPTLLDLIGIPVPHQAQGKSLKDLVCGKKAKAPYSALLGEHGAMSSLRSRRWKLLVGGDGKKEMFDLDADPGEKRDVFGKNKKIASEMESRLKDWEASLPSYEEGVPYLPEIDEAARKRIEKTGYW